MEIKQFELKLKAKERGFHLVTDEVFKQIPELTRVSVGLLHLFIQHSSASLFINEYADPSVRSDLEEFYSELCNNKAYYTHTSEGSDDMPSHVKASILGTDISIPITSGRPSFGTWQGIIMGEHRIHAGSRKIVATLIYD
jgi:secondary thiamine-phosphate synthase enzyme